MTPTKLFEQDPNVILIPIQAWILLPDAPVQRDTARHAERAKRKHLKEFNPAHRSVVAAQWPNGDMCKIDGHCRAFLWNTGELKRPNGVSATIFQVTSLEEIQALYDAYDSREAVETSQDKVFGTMRNFGLTPRSKLVSEGAIASALGILCGKKPIRDATALWQNEIATLDQMMIPCNRKKDGTLISGEIAAFLVTVRRHGEKAIKFWKGYVQGLGEYKDGNRDGREALRWYRHTNKISERGGRRELCERAINACEGFLAKRKYKRGLRKTDLVEYLKR